MDPVEILQKPYARQVVCQPDGVFKAEIFEFPGCFAIGETAPEALANLEDVALEWIEVTVSQGQNIPEPSATTGYSGNYPLRMSKLLHKRAAQFALREGVSLNQFVNDCISERVGLLARPASSEFQNVRSLTNINLTLEQNFGSGQMRLAAHDLKIADTSTANDLAASQE